MRRLTILYAGAVRSGVHTTLKALDPRTPFCESALPCLRHRAYGPHLAAGPEAYVEELRLPFEAGGRSYDLALKACQQKGSLAGGIREVMHLNPMIARQFEWLGQADAIVFVVSLKAAAVGSCVAQLESLTRDLVTAGRTPEQIPLVFQLNKHDLLVDDPDPEQRAAPVEELKRKFLWPGCDYVESIATRRFGVNEALERVLELHEERSAGSTPSADRPGP